VAYVKGAVRVIDRGFKKLIARIRGLAHGYVTVGVHGDQVTPDGTSLALVASANEFGVGSPGSRPYIPPRSFMRSTMDEERQAIADLQARCFTLVALGKMSPEQGLGLIGAFAKGKVQAKIASNVPPKLAESTLRKKYPKTRTLIDTGQLRQGIEYRVLGRKR
jgi:hypothetical protein